MKRTVERTFVPPRVALERRVRLTMLLPIGLTALLAAALVCELLLLLASAGSVDHLDRVIAQARHIGGLVAARANALERYLETGDDEQRAGFDKGERPLNAALVDLGQLIGDNPEQEARRRQLLASAASWSQAVAPLVAQRSGHERGADDAVGRLAADELRRLNRQLSDFVTVEERLRDDRSHRTHALSRAVVAGTLLGALLLGVTLGLLARRHLRALAAEHEATVAHAHEQMLLLSQEERFRRLIEAVEDYAIFLVDPGGNVSSWNAGAERGTGWRAEEILGRPFATFFTPDDRAAARPQRDLELAAQQGVARGEERRVRKDGSQFIAEVALTAVRDSLGQLVGFVSIARDITERRQSEVAISKLNAELEQRIADLAAANAELEAFSYSVSHDLRGPLRAIDGFSKILMEDYRERLDGQGQHYLARVRAGSQRMGHLIDALLSLARVTRAEMDRGRVDLAQIAREVVEELRRHEPARVVDVVIVDRAPASGDAGLLRAALENLLGNAWKFTGKTTAPRIELGVQARDGGSAYYVRDNGAGFDMAYAHKLFVPFQRLHERSEFEGAGIGLATVQRIITRHGGKLWAESTPGQGATFWFTLGSDSLPRDD
ncbi:MAG: hybrid sensor histidine kinase/response regulator [bacterium]|nr:hybrid sensor histidine kinase/response regulator [bacterium]